MSWFSSFNNLLGRGFNDLTGASDAYDNSMKAWHMQNAYNTPAAQIARMQEAGIDVNPLIYAVGNGSMSSGNATGSPNMSSSGVNPLSTVVSMVHSITDFKRKSLENDMLEKDLEFYEKNGYRPGTSNWTTILPALLAKFQERPLPEDKQPVIFHINNDYKGPMMGSDGDVVRKGDLRI